MPKRNYHGYKCADCGTPYEGIDHTADHEQHEFLGEEIHSWTAVYLCANCGGRLEIIVEKTSWFDEEELRDVIEIQGSHFISANTEVSD